ncbi:hypothetical protein PV11_08231 [Exophiala sideris]|uniref:Amidohydrolase-related domain-containing protein n=1 Tax=Exophiala sideris TaxID=1016849 RepID=A0A0D1Z1I1_9EURO|nr:hypothetical protein PV11_08231 [Exophiala sideris]
MGSRTIHTDLLFDPIQKKFIKNVSIKVDEPSGLITDVIHRDGDVEGELGDSDIDLRGKVVLPGFVDAHSHIFLHSYDEASAVVQKRDESFVERVIRSVNHCRIGLLAGYTTYRDLGSESMQDADCNVRDAINRGLIPGPRLYVATKVIASTGGFESRTENGIGGHCMPAGAEAADGPDELRKAVRRRIAAGADIIKFFGDYRRRIMRFPPKQQHPYIGSVKFPPAVPNETHVMFTQEEMNTIVEEAELADCPVAAHCITKAAAKAAAIAGALTIEHAFNMDDETLLLFKERGTILVPTLAVFEHIHKSKVQEVLVLVKRAWDLGVRLACGGDTGTYPHGDNAREMELMIEAGIPVEDVLTAGTVGGWDACGGDRCGRRFGWFEEGTAADIIALDADPREDKDALRKVSFVMKDAQVWKREGQAVGMV